MFRRLVDHIERKSLPSFWDSKHNLFATLTIPQLEDMLGKVKRIEKKLQNAVTRSDWDGLHAIICE